MKTRKGLTRREFVKHSLAADDDGDDAGGGRWAGDRLSGWEAE
jgi:hypothetical protein